MSWGGAALVCGAAKRGTSLHTLAAPERTKAGAFPRGWVEPATIRRCRAHPLSGYAFAGASKPGVASANPFVSRERGVRWHRSSEISLAGSAPRSRAAQLIKLRQSASFGQIWTETTDRRHRVPPPAGLNRRRVKNRVGHHRPQTSTGTAETSRGRNESSNNWERIALTGPHMRIGNNAVTNVALLLHELATNPAKYGTLSLPEVWFTLIVPWRMMSFS
jgi:hypothetical protein